MQIFSEEVLSKAIILIKEGEGLRLDVYIDTEGHQTIGYGHKLLPEEIGQLTNITLEEAQTKLLQSLQDAQREVISYWGDNLSRMGDQRIAVLLDMTYNCGKIRWPRLTKAISDCNWEQASFQILDTKYRLQVKVRAFRNAQIMKEGKLYSSADFTKKENQWILKNTVEIES